MNRLRNWARRWFAQGGYQDQLDLLYASDAAEQRAYDRMREHEDPADCELDVRTILYIRTERVEILHRLGWHAEARKLAADTEMRRGWVERYTSPEPEAELFTVFRDPSDNT